MIGDTVIYGFFHRLVQFHSRIMIFSDSAYECCVLPQYQTFLQQQPLGAPVSDFLARSHESTHELQALPPRTRPRSDRLICP